MRWQTPTIRTLTGCREGGAGGHGEGSSRAVRGVPNRKVAAMLTDANDPLAVLTRVLYRLDDDLKERVPAVDVVRIVQLTIEEYGR